jgi:hypothetical protein
MTCPDPCFDSIDTELVTDLFLDPISIRLACWQYRSSAPCRGSLPVLVWLKCASFAHSSPDRYHHGQFERI